jgi:hypothetical protein
LVPPRRIPRTPDFPAVMIGQRFQETHEIVEPIATFTVTD